MFRSASDILRVVGRDVRSRERFYGDASAERFRLWLEIDYEIGCGDIGGREGRITFVEFSALRVDDWIGGRCGLFP